MDTVRGFKVLIVDDDWDNVGVMDELLTYHGADVLCASDGQQGLDLLRVFRPGLILLDLAMPEVDGWHMVEELRANPRTAHIPVVAVTALTSSDAAERIRTAGFDGFIAKPFHVAAFLREVLFFIPKSRLQEGS